MIKAVLFDFDGVLTLDETGSQSICNYVCAITGIEKDTFSSAYRKYNADLIAGRIKHEGVWDKICETIGCPIKIDVLHDSFIHTPINTEMLKLARKLKDMGFMIGMVTDNKADRIKSIFEYHQWGTLFDGAAVSAEVGSGKNHEHIFHSIFRQLSVAPEECVFIDNNEANLIVPRNMGVTTIFYDYKKNDVVDLMDALSGLGIGLG